MDIGGKTKVTGLFGWPVEHSLSPLMHNAAFGRLNLDYCYVTFPVRPDLLADAVRAVRALGLSGVNVTVPHKENVIPHLDEIDKEASFIGAVNTIVNRDGKLTGYNTDGRGFMKSLQEAGIEVSGKNVLIVGTGGASRAISYYLSEKASALYLFDIDIPKAERLIGDLSEIRGNVKRAEDIKSVINDMDIMINATPLGLKETDPLPIRKDLIFQSTTVIDLIYKETLFLKEAKKRGCRTLDGLGMLLWQGVIAFELWTGVKPPLEVMRNALLAGMNTAKK